MSLAGDIYLCSVKINVTGYGHLFLQCENKCHWPVTFIFAAVYGNICHWLVTFILQCKNKCHWLVTFIFAAVYRNISQAGDIYLCSVKINVTGW
jgi:hypothetical protein